MSEPHAGRFTGECLNLYAYALIAFVAYIALVAVGRRVGAWKRLGVTLHGPVMMLSTTRGRETIARVASRKRLWTAYGTASVGLTLIATGTLTGLLFWAVLATSSGQALPDLGTAASPRAGALVLLVYIAIGTIIAVLVHEFMHGVLSIVGNIKLDSVGVLLLLVPIGAFVEPNDRQLMTAPWKKRLRLYAAGPATNIALALACGILLVGALTPSIKPVQEGAVVTQVAPDSPAQVSGLSPWSEITQVGGENISSAADFHNVSFSSPGGLTSIRATMNGRNIMLALPSGIVVTSVSDGPALNAGIEPGMIIRSLDNKTIHCSADLSSAIETAPRNQSVEITVLRFGEDNGAGANWFVTDHSITTVNLTSKWLYYYLHYPAMNRDEYRNESFLGASASPFGLLVDDPERLMQPVAHPFAGVKGVNGLAGSSLRYIALPFYGRVPVVSPVADLYEPSGALSFLPGDIYWIIVDLVYWIFWVNLMLGFTNALPAIPLDGALVLRDLLRSFARRIGARLTVLDLTIGRRPIPERQVDRVMVVITVLVSGMILYLLLWQVLGPF